jgi:hypothetical protein
MGTRSLAAALTAAAARERQLSSELRIRLDRQLLAGH